MPVLPSRDVLRAAYNDAVREIDQSRDRPMLTTAFYAQIGDSLFDACYRALEDYCEAQGDPKDRKPPRTHVVSAPVGAGKTTFSTAFIAALVRVTEGQPEAPYGCVFVADQITKADQMYRDLSVLLPGKVGIWTTDHDKTPSDSQRDKAKVPNPSARFDVDELRQYPVAIVTHAFYSGSRGHKARGVVADARYAGRALTIVDEQPNQVDIVAVTYSQAERVWEGIAEDDALNDDDKVPVLELTYFMAGRAAAVGGLEKPTDDREAWSSAKNLQWFTTEAATKYARARQREVPNIAEVFAFAKSLTNGYAFIARGAGGKGVAQFIGYESNLMRTHGMVLLDATADIDGVTQLCPWREMQAVPQARFDNLSIVHVPSMTRERAATFLKTAKNRRAYVTHMESVIREQMHPGQKGLVVVKKRLVDDEAVQPTPEGFTWDLEGRALAVTHWGVGIGANCWKGADVVFLFDEFYIPRRAAIATTQGLREHKATEGALAAITTQNSKHADVEAVWQGHLLRWNKQMGLRGNGRCYDADGVCGKQKLVVMGDVDRLLAHKDRLFPGATVTTTEAVDGSRQTYATKLYALLSTAGLPPTLKTSWVSQHLKAPWRDVSKNLMVSAPVLRSIEALGWRYVSRRGRGGSYFERAVPQAA
jgi:hypothetical protein